MKRTMRKLSMMMVIVLIISLMSISAFAANDNNTLNITSETNGHTYQVYQVFDGDYSESGGSSILTNVTWGSDVNGPALLAALQADATYGANFTGLTTAAETADAIAGIADADFPAALADIIADHVTTPTSTTSTATGTGPYTYQFTGLLDGYFFVNEAAFGGTVDNAYTKFVLQVLGDVTVAAKTDKPAVAKKVLENNDATYQDSWNDAADYSIGDDVPFRIVGLIPDMTYYDTYSYTMTDTMSDGLSFNLASAKVYIASGINMLAVETSTSTGAGGSDVTGEFTVAANATGFTVSVADLSAVTGATAGDYVVVEYTAELDSDAVIGNPGNPNEVYLTYSNNPNDNTDFGQTPKDEVVVYTFELPVAKVDDETPANPLTDATFALFENSAQADAAVADPTVLTGALTFSGAAGVYTLDAAGSATLASDGSGEYLLSGLDQGTYYLVEIDEPVGYNRLSASVQVDIVPTYSATEYVDGHTADDTNDQLTAISINSGSSVTVVNEKGSILPETGGIGTTIFTIGGIILMIGAAVVFITKRKVAAHKE